jgi:hypothetical protein
MSKQHWPGKKDRLSKMNQRQAKTDEQAALAREKDRLSKMNQCQAETDKQAAFVRTSAHCAVVFKFQTRKINFLELIIQQNYRLSQFIRP